MIAELQRRQQIAIVLQHRRPRGDIGRQRLLRLVLPGATPAIFAGLRIALIYAWLGTIGAEYFMPSDGGIGSLMIGAQQLFHMDQVMAGMLLIGITGALLNSLGQLIEARATRWRTA